MGLSTRDVVVLLVVIFICLLVGYMIGTYTTIKAVVKIASNFVTIDEALVRDAIFSYQHQLRGFGQLNFSV